MESSQTFKAAIIGSTGAIGRELVKLLVNFDAWEKVTVLARRKLEEWDGDAFKDKLKIILF